MEARLKKFIVIALALFLAIPAISFAGSATSRWDLTIGGYINFGMGYATKQLGADYFAAPRGSGDRENQADEYGNFFASGVETRLNFLIKGPDGWGAKTTGFIEGDFRGGSNSGEFALRHAFMKMQWANDSLTIGHTWQKWGLMPSFGNTLLAWNMLGAFLKGTRQPQIMWDHSFNKNFKMALGIISPNNTLVAGGVNASPNSFSFSRYPFIESELIYTSDACGKIGPWQMLFGLGGFYGWDRKIYADDAAATTYSDDLDKAWGVAFKGFIPIIPEKKGNKAGALSLSGVIFATQNPSWYMGPYTLGGYNTTGDPFNPRYSYPRMFGGWGQMSYWFTNDFYISGWYGSSAYTFSSRYKADNPNNMQKQQQYIVNLSYDVNPAMRLGLEWDYIYTRWAGKGTTAAVLDRDGKMNAFRIGAWYFF
jgi:hypothetical protein